MEKLPQESISIPLPPLLFCLPFFCFLTLSFDNPTLLLTSNLLPLAPALGLLASPTDLFRFPKSAGKNLQGKLFTHTFLYLPASSVSCTGSQRGVQKGKTRAMKCPEHVGSNRGGSLYVETANAGLGMLLLAKWGNNGLRNTDNLYFEASRYLECCLD